MEGRGHERHLQRLVEGGGGSCSNHSQRASSFNGTSGEPRIGFSFGSGPRHTSQEPSLFSESVSRPSFDSPRPPAHYNASGRLSLAPPGLYNQQDSSEPRVLTNADNHFKFTQNLRQGVPMIQPPPARPATTQQPDPISRVANAMLSQRQIPLTNPAPQPANYFQPPSRQQNPLQPQMQQVTPIYNLSGFKYSPNDMQTSKTSSSPSGEASSPTTRISLRRATNRARPVAENVSTEQDDFDEYGDANGDVEEEPQTPRNQIIPRANQNTLGSTPSSHKSHNNRNVLREEHSHRAMDLSHAPPMANGIQLVSPHELPDRIRQVFPFQLFNAVQSKCFAPIYRTNDNIVVSSPTGSGKTALLELAICRALEGHGSGQFKIVYQAPTKSLCSERLRDWGKKFSHLNLPCAELTGDTSQAEMARVRAASIIITTPEKWDSITRKWSDHHKLVQMVKLFLIDEVHILRDPRGATLEAVVSRMKTIGADVRFVALSATVPNSHDIALWLGRDHTNPQLPAHRETFGESFRPVKLQKHVYGFEANSNDYAFERVLDGKLPNLIKKHTHKKPIMVFGFTRKSCESTAALLVEWWNRERVVDRAWPAPGQRTVVGSKELQELLKSGVAFHHAGLDIEDRRAVETAFLKGDISVICCTSTLAVGVNLPCHLVVLKGTMGYQNGVLTEYSDLEVMQMLGRAGRPQFDDSAVAIIMTKRENQVRYDRMMSGQDILESTLHLNLIEHLNSEIGLGTVNSLYKAKNWLSGTFLAVRMRQNPDHYKISGIPAGGDTDRRLEQVCERDIKLLQDNELISDGDRISCTEYGEAMSRYMVQFETMKLLLSIPKHAKTEEILNTLCEASEFEDLRMKQKERPCLREYNRSPFIKFPIKEAIHTTAHKISLLIQAQLGGVEHPNSNDFAGLRKQFGKEKNLIFERVQRLIRCVVDCKAFDCDAVATRHALDLARGFSAAYWENSNLQLQQIPQFGPATVKKLVGNSINSVEKLTNLDPATIERYLSRNPPFGKKVKDGLVGFPRLTLTAQTIGRAVTKPGQKPKVNVKAILGFVNAKIPVWAGHRPALTFMAETSDGVLVHFWRGNVSKLEKGYELKFMVELTNPDDTIKCWVACDDIVGTLRSNELQHNVSASDFPPVPKTKPQENPSNRQILSREDDEFGGDDLDDEDLLAATMAVDKPESDYGSDTFLDVDDIGPTLGGNVLKTVKTDLELESVQMANGKWTCNHACRDGNPLKNGKLCKHKCCIEGLEKPRRVRKTSAGSGQLSLSSKGTNERGSENQSKKQPIKTSAKELGSRAPKKTAEDSQNVLENPKLSNPKLTRDNSWNVDNVDDMEMIDLTHNAAPVTYADLAPREFHKLNILHNSVPKNQPDKKTLRLPKQKPQFEYGSGKMAQLPFDPPNQSYDDDFGSDDVEFPSPSALLGRQKKSPEPLEAGPNTYEDGMDLESFPDDSLDSLGAGIIGLSDSMLLRAASPRVSSSFANRVFDFDAYEKDNQVQVEDEHMKENEPSVNHSTDQLGENRLKRGFSPSPAPDEPEVKHRRVSKLELAQEPSHEPSVPAWVDEFDPEFLDGLMGIVDFVD